jgi:hypothetical protein
MAEACIAAASAGVGQERDDKNEAVNLFAGEIRRCV